MFHLCTDRMYNAPSISRQTVIGHRLPLLAPGPHRSSKGCSCSVPPGSGELDKENLDARMESYILDHCAILIKQFEYKNSSNQVCDSEVSLVYVPLSLQCVSRSTALCKQAYRCRNPSQGASKVLLGHPLLHVKAKVMLLMRCSQEILLVVQVIMLRCEKII